MGTIAAGLLVVVASVGCSRGSGDNPGPKAVAVDGRRVESERLAGAVAGLCRAREQAAADPGLAKATYVRQSRLGIGEAARALQPSYSVAAAAVTEATAVVEADLAVDPPRPSLALDLGRLTEVTREGLARIGISTRPCPR